MSKNIFPAVSEKTGSAEMQPLCGIFAKGAGNCFFHNTNNTEFRKESGFRISREPLIFSAKECKTALPISRTPDFRVSSRPDSARPRAWK